MSVAVFDLGQHLVDVSRRVLMFGRGPDDGDLPIGAGARALAAGGLDCLAHPFRNRQVLPGRNRSQGFELRLVEQHLQSFTHDMSVMHS